MTAPQQPPRAQRPAAQQAAQQAQQPTESYLVTIEHPDTGRRYQVTEEVYQSTYQEQGYEITAYADGTTYGGDDTPTKHAVDTLANTPEIGSGTSTEEAPAEPTATPTPTPAPAAPTAPAAPAPE